jgi:chromatin structure-remodeling complex subunit RSC1/2
MAFSTIKVREAHCSHHHYSNQLQSKFLKKNYINVAQFVRDGALIVHNAQTYNRPSSAIYKAATRLREEFIIELTKLVSSGLITQADATLPDLGPLPDADDFGPEEDDEADEDDEEEDEDEEDEEDEDEDSGDEEDTRKRRGRKARKSTIASKRTTGATQEKEDPDPHKKRGRPPKVFTPLEARINGILKGLRKFKDPDGHLKIVPFEKMPDKQSEPGYYEVITNPMVMDLIKRKAKRKIYRSVAEVMKDINLMFENAKAYNEDDSQLYADAVELQKEAKVLAEQEMKKPDSDFVDEDGKLPLPEILHNGTSWKVGK